MRLISLLLLPLLTVVAPPARLSPRPAPQAAPAPIIWSASRPLTFADFQGRPKPTEKLAALTSADLKAGASCRNYTFTGTVQASFDPSASWLRDPNEDSAELLRHEQLHFDLTEVYARILRQRLAALPAKIDCRRLQPAFDQVTQGVYAEWEREESRYDEETNHGLSKPQQAQWEKQTAQRLEQLQAFAAK